MTVAVTDTGKVLALIGAMCAIPQMYIVPPLMVICTEGNGGGKSAGGALVVPYAVLVLGVLLFCACTYSSLEAFAH